MPQGSFTHHLTLTAEPDVVFAGFSSLELRRRWARIPDADGSAMHSLDFRVDGTEVIRGSLDVGNGVETILVRWTFLDIVPSVRIVAAVSATVNDLRRTASLVTIDFLPGEGGGTELRYSEHVVILLPADDGSAELNERRGGTRLQLNGLAAAL
jgi:uncharacterized protein YndB with AHSA1/START domain